MVGIVEASAAIAGLQSALKILIGLDAAADAVAINDAKITLQTAILDAQGKLFDMQEAQTASVRRLEALEQEIARLQDWSKEAERYCLAEVDPGAFAYMPKVGMEAGEPAHWLCTNCFSQGRKSVMQSQGQDTLASGHLGYQRAYSCITCNNSFKTHNATVPTYEARG